MAVNTIVLKGAGRYEEGEADAAILPGEAIELAPDGNYDPCQASQANAIKRRGLQIAIEDALQGKTVDDAYADGDRVFFYIPIPGDEIQVLVKSGENIDVGEKLVVEGGGSGKFVASGGSETAYQLESLEDSGGALGAATLMRCRVL